MWQKVPEAGKTASDKETHKKTSKNQLFVEKAESLSTNRV